MSRRILLVRAVNVGGTTLPMAAFRQVLAELGAERVRTHLASGNAVAEIPGDPEAFDRGLERALAARFGWEREVLSRTPAELDAALAAYPFEVVDERFAQLSFLTAAPTPDALDRAAAVPTGDDLWRAIGREVHLRYARGAGRADLDLGRLHRALGVPGTARNLRTVRALVALSDGWGDPSETPRR